MDVLIIVLAIAFAVAVIEWAYAVAKKDAYRVITDYLAHQKKGQVPAPTNVLTKHIPPPAPPEHKPKEVYVCILSHDDGCFKMIVGCFYDQDAADRYAGDSPNITIQKLNVI